MPPEKRDPALLWDILNTAKKAIKSIEGLELKDYLANENLRLTVERRIEIIGEAARRVSEDFRNNHPNIPWKKMIGQRNVMAHDYDEIDHERVFNLVKEHLPGLISLLEPLVPSPPE